MYQNCVLFVFELAVLWPSVSSQVMYDVLQGQFCQPVHILSQLLNDQSLCVIRLHFSVPAGQRNVMSM